MRKKEAEERALKRRSVRTVVASILSSGFVAAVGALLLFGWIAEEVPEGDAAGFDDAVRGFVHARSMPWATELMQGFSFLGSTIFLTAATIAVLFALIYFRHRHSALLFTVMMAGATVLEWVLKITFVRPRPVPYFDSTLPGSYSFPSGHALFSLCFYGGLAWILTAHLTGFVRKTASWIVTVPLVLLIGLSRIYLGVHYPTDVVAGYAASLFWVIAVFSSDKWIERSVARLSHENHGA